MKTNRLLVAGGGTGGHVLSGIAIADEWRKKFGQQSEILFVGSEKGLEARLVPKYGYDLKLLSIGALNKVSSKTRLLTMLQLPLSFIKSFFILCAFRPTAVIGVGGYASGPVVLLARILAPFFGTVTAILEQNSVAGFTNRVLGKWVHLVFSAFEDSHHSFSAHKVRVTGNPIRSHFKKLPASVDSPFTLFIFGGSQGAMGMNSMVIDALPFLKSSGIRFIHQTGVNDFERVTAAYLREGMTTSAEGSSAGTAAVRIEKFIDDMGACYTQASLVICRAGASSMAELASVGRAAIFVPLPTAADNHQEINARVFQKANAALVVPQGSVTGAQFAEMILALKSDHQQIHQMETNVQPFYQSTAAENIVKALTSTR